MLSGNHINGYFLISRSLFTSDIWSKPPEYIKIWIFLIGKACHQSVSYNGYHLERGQCFLSTSELTEQIRYMKGYVKERKSESTVKRILAYLRETGRISTMKKPRGMIVTILNYDKYQTANHYDRTTQEVHERTTDKPKRNYVRRSINKNVNNVKKDNRTTDENAMRTMRICLIPHVQDVDVFLAELAKASSVEAVKEAARQHYKGQISSINEIKKFCLQYVAADPFNTSLSIF